MKNFFLRFVLIFVVFACFQNSSLATETDSDIRFRSVVYFYPDIKNPDISDLPRFFKGFKVVDKLPKEAHELVLSYSLTKEVQKLYPVPDLKHLSYFGEGLDKEQANLIQRSDTAVIIDIAYPKKKPFKKLHAATRALYEFSVSKNGLIWDSDTRVLYTPEAWKKKRLDSWGSKAIPSVADHIVIHAYKSDGGTRAISLGMAKFGLPDIVVSRFSWSLNNQMGSLINLVAQSIVEGAAPIKEGSLLIDINKLQESNYKKDLIASLAENATLKVELPFGVGRWEEGDPDNYIIELLFNKSKGSSLSERQESLLSDLFGLEDNVVYIQHNELILAASKRARKKLDGLRQDFNEGLAPAEFILLKAPFAMPGGGSEWMWVEVSSWTKAKIKGMLKNEPRNIPDLQAGSDVVIKPEQVFDYMRKFPDGSYEGNETGELIQKFKIQ